MSVLPNLLTVEPPIIDRKPLSDKAVCPNCGSSVVDEIRDLDRQPADASALLICLDCSGILGVVA